MDEQLILEKEKYREEMATLLGRLKGMDDLMKREHFFLLLGITRYSTIL